MTTVEGRDEAAFDAIRVRGGTRAPVAALGLALLVGSVAGVGLFGRSSAGPLDGSTAAASVPRLDVAAPPGPPGPTSRAAVPRYAAPIAIDARVDGRSVVVHGDVLTPGAVVVVVTVADTEDDIVESRAIDLPAASTAGRHGRGDRFHLAVPLPDDVAAGWVQASAYDASGAVITSVRERLAAPHVTDGWRVQDEP